MDEWNATAGRSIADAILFNFVDDWVNVSISEIAADDSFVNEKTDDESSTDCIDRLHHVWIVSFDDVSI